MCCTLVALPHRATRWEGMYGMQERATHCREEGTGVELGGDAPAQLVVRHVQRAQADKHAVVAGQRAPAGAAEVLKIAQIISCND